MATFEKSGKSAIPVFLFAENTFQSWIKEQPEFIQNWAKKTGFAAKASQTCLIPAENGELQMALGGLGTERQKRYRFLSAKLASSLPDGTYKIESQHSEEEFREHYLGWLLSHYKFGRYNGGSSHGAALSVTESGVANEIEAIAAGEFLTRDLINTPASDMGPDELEAASRNLVKQHGAEIKVVMGDDLLSHNFPMIHTVGRASNRAPRLIELNWGNAGPKVTLVGKGVCFDTGGLNIKPAGSMGLMKKDMGGAANALGLAQMLMTAKSDIQLRVLIPAVENSIDGSAFRPQDILTSRKGLTVEINNTDAEGRLVLADALAYAEEAPSDLLVSLATLTGAARVAVGPDLAPFYTDADDTASLLENAAHVVRDPVWRMPFYDPYESMIEPGIADLDNAPKGGFAGSITAALFLRRFVNDGSNYVHFDIYGWQPTNAPGRPKGGVGQGIRALFEAIQGLALK